MAENKGKKFIKYHKSLTINLAILLILSIFFGGDYIAERTRQTIDTAKYQNTVTVMNVGQADSTLIESAGEFCLIDAGATDDGISIISYLKERKVESIKLLVITHFHTDHISQVEEILNTYKVEGVLIPDLSQENLPTTTFFDKLLTKAENGEFDIHLAKKGWSKEIGSGVFSVIDDTDNTNDINGTSVACLFTQGNFTYVDAGDIGFKTEKLILPNIPTNVTVFNANHHGSKGSNSKEFVGRLSPKYVAISCGENNRYGHPHSEVINTFADLGLKYSITWQEGNLIYSMDTLTKTEGLI
ncbi:MAG: MBL fold metallo-hydrolase [Oscillospiraceae bacterium]